VNSVTDFGDYYDSLGLGAARDGEGTRDRPALDSDQQI